MPTLFLSQFKPRPNQLIFNTLRIMQLMKKAKAQNVSIIVFGETALQGYNVKNSLVSERFFKATESCLRRIRKYADHLNLGIILGTYRKNQSLYGKPAKNGVWTYFPSGINGLSPEDSYQEKQLIPRQAELNEILYVAAGKMNTMRVRTIGTKRVVYHVCQDSWRETPTETYQKNPLHQALALHPDVLINLSASPWYEGKWYNILEYMLMLSAKHKFTIVYLPIAGFEDQQFQFTAGGFVVHCGHIKRLLPRFIEEEAIVNLETIANEPNVNFDVSLRYLSQHKQNIKIESIHNTLTAVIHSLSSQYGIADTPLLTTQDEFVKEIIPFLPEATDTVNYMHQFNQNNAKCGFALEFTNEITDFLLIHLLRKHAPSKAKIVLGLYEILNLTRKQKDFLREHRVDTFYGVNHSFRAYARENKLLLLDSFHLTQYVIGNLDTNLYGLSLLGSLTLSIIYKLLLYCQLESRVQLPDEIGMLQQKLIDSVVKRIQRLPDFDTPELTKQCLPYFTKRLKHRLSSEKIEKQCHTTVSSVLKKSIQESWHGTRAKQDNIVQLTMFAPARTCKTNPTIPTMVHGWIKSRL